MTTRTTTISGALGSGGEPQLSSTQLKPTIPQMSNPTGVCVSPDGTIFIADKQHHLVKQFKANHVETVSQSFSNPTGISVLNDKLYVTEPDNHVVRKLSNGEVAIRAGSGVQGNQEGYQYKAQFNRPLGICIASPRQILVTDREDHTIKMIIDKLVVTIAGNGSEGFRDGYALRAQFSSPHAICISHDGLVFITEHGCHRVRMLHRNQVTTIAGGNERGYVDGNCCEARFDSVGGICASNDGKLFVADTLNNRIRMICDGKVTTVAGTGVQGSRDGEALECEFNCPTGISLSDNGTLYVVECANQMIRKVALDRDIIPQHSAMCDPFYHPKADFDMTVKLSFKDLFSAKNLSDCTITINSVKYELHRKFLEMRCPGLLDVEKLNLIQRANISNDSINSFIVDMYSGNPILITGKHKHLSEKELTKSDNPLETMHNFFEFIFLCDVLLQPSYLLNIRSKDFAEEVKLFTKGYPSSMAKFSMKIFAFLYEKTELLKEHQAKQDTSLQPITKSSTEILYDFVLYRLKKTSSATLKNITTLFKHLPSKKFFDVCAELTHKTPHGKKPKLFNTEDLYSCDGCDLYQMCDMALSNTNFPIQKNEKIYLGFSPKAYSNWIAPDFVIKLPQSDKEYLTHKLVLYGRWPAFRNMIQSNIYGAEDNKLTLTGDWDEQLLFKFMKYIYLDQIDFETNEDAQWLVTNPMLDEIIVNIENENARFTFQHRPSVIFQKLYEYRKTFRN